MFSFPNIFDMLIAIQILFLGTILIVFISNKITGLIETVISFFPILLIIHLNIICFLHHFLKSILLYLEIQKTTYSFDKNVYADTSIIIGPVIAMTSSYIQRFFTEYLIIK